MNNTPVSISFSNNGKLVLIFGDMNGSSQIELDTRDVHYISIKQDKDGNTMLHHLCFNVHHDNLDVLTIINEFEAKNTIKIFDRDHCNEETLCCTCFTLKTPINCVVFESFLRYTDLSADVSTDFVCVEYPHEDNDGTLTYINFDYMYSFYVFQNQPTPLYLLNFRKEQDKIVDVDGSVYHFNQLYVTISFETVVFSVDVNYLIQVFNKQRFGSYNSYRTKLMQRRLSFMVEKLSRLKQIPNFLNMPVNS